MEKITLITLSYLKYPSFLQGSGGSFGIRINDVTQWGNTGSSFKWSRRWSKKIFSNTLVSYSNYFSNRDRSANISRTDDQGNKIDIRRGTLEDNDLKDYSLKTDIEYKLNKHNFIEFGYHITHNDIKYSYAQSDTSKLIDRATKGNIYALYAQDKISFFKNRLQLIPGVRMNYFDQTRKWYTEPRLNATLEVTDKIKLKGFGGQVLSVCKKSNTGRCITGQP
ncbi:MAG: TonB-dependent receptor [Bacteroidia bacterium]|nr:TonB-dependent receptor [Bacteroidia bacterium]